MSLSAFYKLELDMKFSELNKKTIGIGMGLFSLSALTYTSCAEGEKKKEEPPKRPNILLILADDMGFSDLGCYGSEIQTPNLDSLAENGLRFTQFYNTSKSFPSRACLLTGLYAQQAGMLNTHGHFSSNSVTLAEVLKDAGYRTLMTGKHHGDDNPVDFGFDRYYGLRDGCCNYFNPGVQREGEGRPAYKGDSSDRVWCIDDSVISPYTPEAEEFYTTDYFTKYALEYLDQYEDEERPFFLYMAYTAPHDPLHAWPKDIKKYEDKYKVGYKKIRQRRYKRQKEMGLIDDRFPLSEPAYLPWDSLNKEQKRKEARKMAVYAAMIDRMDQNIGKVLQKLRKMGEAQNTLVMFASDNGANPNIVNIEDDYGKIGTLTRWASQGENWANVSNTPYRKYKNWSHQGGIGSPLIAYWPEGIEGESRISHYTGHFIDFMPTLLEISGASYPERKDGSEITPYEGRSLVPVFRNNNPEPRDFLYNKWRGGEAVITPKWKIVSSINDKQWELYDIKSDKTETENLRGQHPEVVNRLDSLYENWIDNTMPE